LNEELEDNDEWISGSVTEFGIRDGDTC
jgi:hypothetical protein